MDYLNDTEYFRHYNEGIVYSIEDIIIPYVSQFAYYSARNHYNRIIQILLELYDYRDIYYSMGVYLMSQKEEIEDDMEIVRELLSSNYEEENRINVQLNNNVIERVNQLMNIILPILPNDYDIPVNMEPVRVFVPRDILDKLPEVSFMELKTDETTCSICMEDFEADTKIRKISCCHLFHTKCLDTWLSENYKCPVCRKEIAEHRHEL